MTTNKKRSSISLQEFKKKADGFNRAGKGYFLSVLVILVMILGTSYFVDTIYNSSNKVQSSYELIVEAQEVRASVESMETSLRGYILYYDNDFLVSYNYSKNKAKESLSNAYKNSSITTYDKERLNIIKSNLSQWEVVADKTIQTVSPDIVKNIKWITGIRKSRKGLTPKIRLATDDIITSHRTMATAFISESFLKKRFISILLFLGSFSTIWIISNQIKKVRQSTKDMLSTTEMLARENDLREDLEDTLRDTIAIYSSLLDAALDAIIIIDQTGRIIEASSSCKEIFDYKPQELVGEFMSEMIIPPHLKEAHKAGFARYLSTEKPVILGKRIKTEAMNSHKKVFPVELTVVRIEKEGDMMFAAFLRKLEEDNV